jgi:hypothetical protein
VICSHQKSRIENSIFDKSLPFLTIDRVKKITAVSSTLPANAALSPQEIQSAFPEYAALSSDMLEVNRKLIKYREILERLAIGKNLE